MSGVPPTMIYETSLEESIRSLSSGFVSSTVHMDIVISTFSGKILSFSADPGAADATGAGLTADYTAAAPASPSKKDTKKAQQDEKAQAKEREKRFRNLTNEVETL